jgi:hydroxymethylpyrimidine kinase / phosphomethylpyrimidine kinase / thiamine-phosphate diphosphorylase
MRPTVLVIAGSDSSGGAGIQADLKALDHIGIHGATAITAVTSQNSTEVRTVFPLTPGAVLDQAAQVLKDLDVRAIKCGMLYSEPIIRAVADLIEDRKLPAVIDPVLVATSGGILAKEGAARVYLQHLVPRAWAVTPNAHEAEAMLGAPVATPRAAARAAAKFVSFGARSAIVKGGHLADRRRVVDTIAVKTRGAPPRIERISSPRSPSEFHGAGCHFASFLAGFAARGLPPERAFRLAHGILQQTILHAERLGRGPRFLETPPQRFVLEDDLEGARAQVVWDLAEGVLGLVQLLSPANFPEVGINFGFAMPRARTAADVAAVDGRIVVSGGRGAVGGPLRFGGSRHVARILLACAKAAPRVRSACNLRWSSDIGARARKARLSLASFDRAKEPRRAGVSTMSWGTLEAIRTQGGAPDLIADEGAVGKEPMVRVLGRTPMDVLSKVSRLTRA